MDDAELALPLPFEELLEELPEPFDELFDELFEELLDEVDEPPEESEEVEDAALVESFWSPPVDVEAAAPFDDARESVL